MFEIPRVTVFVKQISRVSDADESGYGIKKIREEDGDNCWRELELQRAQNIEFEKNRLEIRSTEKAGRSFYDAKDPTE